MEAELASAGVTREAVHGAVALRNAGLTMADVQETTQLRRMMTGLVDDKMGALVRELIQFRNDMNRALDTINGRLDTMNGRSDTVDGGLDTMDGRINITNTSIVDLQKETRARDQNALARHQNALIHDEQAPLYPLHDLRTADVIPNFPPTERELGEIDAQGATLREIMTALGYRYTPWDGTRALKDLRAAAGYPPRRPRPDRPGVGPNNRPRPVTRGMTGGGGGGGSNRSRASH